MADFPIQNAPIDFDMNDFWGVVDSMGGLAKSCRYGVVISPPRGLRFGSPTNNFIARDLLYLCEATELPGRGFENLEIRYYGPTFKIPHRTEYSDISMTFVCRNESLERQFFDDWMELINPTTTYNFNFRDDYATQIRLFQYRDHGIENSPNYSFTLYDAFPILVNPQPVTWADDNFLRLTINFTYFNWRRDYKDQGLFERTQNQGNFAQNTQNSEAPRETTTQSNIPGVPDQPGQSAAPYAAP